jgi:hypothetical protein
MPQARFTDRKMALATPDADQMRPTRAIRPTVPLMARSCSMLASTASSAMGMYCSTNAITDSWTSSDSSTALATTMSARIAGNTANRA